MNDDYLAYLALRVKNYQNVNVVVLGDIIPSQIKVIKKGGAELMPPIMVRPSKHFDLLDDPMKRSVLDNYIDRIRSIGNAKSLMTAKCLVLTEDKRTEFIESLIEASSFGMEETLVMSYKDCTNLNALDLNIGTIKSVNEKITIIVHRDRDYLNDEEIDRINKHIFRAGALPFNY